MNKFIGRTDYMHFQTDSTRPCFGGHHDTQSKLTNKKKRNHHYLSEFICTW